MNWFSDTIKHQARQYTTFFIPKERVDIDYDDSPMQTGARYCKVWLVKMGLANDIEWGDKRYPVVHTSTSYFYGSDRVTIPFIADAGFLKSLTNRNIDRVIACNYELTPLFPYKKETITLGAGLFSVVGDSLLETSIQLMGQLSSLLPNASEYSKLLKVAEPLGNGIRDLLNIQKKRLELGYLQTFAQPGSGGSNVLRPGYFVAIRAEEDRIDKQALCIVQDQLRMSAQSNNKDFIRQNSPFVNYSYMLFRIEARKERKWDELVEIEQLVLSASDALIHNQDDQVRDTILPMIKGAIMKSPDVVREDRHALFIKVQKELERSRLHGASQRGSLRSLHAIMQQPLPPPDPQLETEFEQLERVFKV